MFPRGVLPFAFVFVFAMTKDKLQNSSILCQVGPIWVSFLASGWLLGPLGGQKGSPEAFGGLLGGPWRGSGGEKKYSKSAPDRLEPILRRFFSQKAPQDGPKRGPRGAPKGSEVKKGKHVKIMVFLRKMKEFGLPGGPETAPRGARIAYDAKIPLEIYKNRLREALQSVLRAKKSCQDRS